MQAEDSNAGSKLRHTKSMIHTTASQHDRNPRSLVHVKSAADDQAVCHAVPHVCPVPFCMLCGWILNQQEWSCADVGRRMVHANVCV
jgi:hypothetical protein